MGKKEKMETKKIAKLKSAGFLRKITKKAMAKNGIKKDDGEGCGLPM